MMEAGDLDQRAGRPVPPHKGGRLPQVDGDCISFPCDSQGELDLSALSRVVLFEKHIEIETPELREKEQVGTFRPHTPESLEMLRRTFLKMRGHETNDHVVIGVWPPPGQDNMAGAMAILDQVFSGAMLEDQR